MSGSHATGQFAELLWPGISKLWGITYKDWPSLYTQFFELDTSDKAFEKEQQITGFPIAGIKDEGDETPFSRMYQGFQKEYRHLTYGIGAVITREMSEDDQYGAIKKIPKLLARSMREVEEVVAHSILNNGFSTPANGGTPTVDAAALFSTSHTLVAGGTEQNTLTTAADLSQTSLENAIQDILDFQDDQGLLHMATPKTLIVPTAYNFLAKKLLQTEKVVGSFNNDKNIIAGEGIKLVVSPYITDTDSWFLSTDVDNGLKFYTRREAELDRDNDFETDNLKIKTTKRFSAGVTDFRGIYGVPGA